MRASVIWHVDATVLSPYFSEADSHVVNSYQRNIPGNVLKSVFPAVSRAFDVMSQTFNHVPMSQVGVGHASGKLV